MCADEREFECVSCGQAIAAEESSNGCGRCYPCFDALSEDGRDRLYEQEILLSDLIESLYPRPGVTIFN